MAQFEKDIQNAIIYSFEKRWPKLETQLAQLNPFYSDIIKLVLYGYIIANFLIYNDKIIIKLHFLDSLGKSESYNFDVYDPNSMDSIEKLLDEHIEYCETLISPSLYNQFKKFKKYL